MFDNIPEEMQRLPHWICWQLKDVAGGKGGRKQTKVPFRIDGKPASTTDPKDWVTFDAAVHALQTCAQFSGIGFVFTSDLGLVGIDLDKCRDPETGETEEWAKAILHELGSYTELSQSGRGWHAIVMGSLPHGGNRRGRVEMYDHDRYFVMTGKRASNSCEEIQVRELTNLHTRLLSGQLDPKPAERVAGRKAKCTDKSPSGKDFALIGSLARKLRTEDPAVIESEIARRYPERYRDQNERHGERRGETYWHYSVVRFFDRRRSQPASEAA